MLVLSLQIEYVFHLQLGKNARMPRSEGICICKQLFNLILYSYAHRVSLISSEGITYVMLNSLLFLHFWTKHTF